MKKNRYRDWKCCSNGSGYAKEQEIYSSALWDNFIRMELS